MNKLFQCFNSTNYDFQDPCPNFVPVQNLRHTSMADPELPADHTWPDTRRGHLDNLQPDVVGQGPAVDEDPAQLVDPALTLERVAGEQRGHSSHFVRSGILF